MKILGYSGFNGSVEYKKARHPHIEKRLYRVVQGLDSAAALVCGGNILAAAAEERFNREKGSGAFPAKAMKFCLDYEKLSANDLDIIAHSFNHEFYQNNLEVDYELQSKYTSLLSRQTQLDLIAEFLDMKNCSEKFVQVPHHLAHAASCYFPSGFEDALLLVLDGMGENESCTLASGEKGKIQIIKQVPAVHSLGVLYGVVTLFLGFEFNRDEYKIMGLAPYGNSERYAAKLMDLVKLRDDGTFSIPFLAERITADDGETYSTARQRLADIFGPERAPNDDLTSQHSDIAAALQLVLQHTVLSLLRKFQSETGHSRLCFAGGVGLNCALNGVIERSGLFEDVFVQPAAGDDGSALGAALYANSQHATQAIRRMGPPLWGPSFEREDIEAELLKLDRERFAFEIESDDTLCTKVAQALFDGKIVAWFQGRMEFGPRALGSRSILADPTKRNIRTTLNQRIKEREQFRPFAPMVIAEHAKTYFDIREGGEETYTNMLFTAPVLQQYREKLAGVTHVDGTARIQTVFRAENPLLWNLLSEFEKLSRFPILLNTSFNINEPIVCTPADALATFLGSSLDILVIGQHLIYRKPIVNSSNVEDQ